MTTSLVELPIKLLFPHPENPRKDYGDDFAEFSLSVKDRGILTPLIVRPRTDGKLGYEIIAGHRRLKAAQDHKLENAPCRVLECSDEEAALIMLIENGQRADIHPLGEANAYESLRIGCKFSIPELAAAVRKSVTYVARRISLLQLTADIRKRWLATNSITLEHALIIARLQPKDQEDAYKACFSDKMLIGAQQLTNWVNRTLFLELSTACFDTKQVNLIPQTVACLDCLKRTGNNASLFPDIKAKDTCTDTACFQKKMDAYIKNCCADITAKTKAPVPLLSAAYGGYHNDGAPKDIIYSRAYSIVSKNKDDICQHTEKGIIIHGSSSRIGEVLNICRHPSCSKHSVDAGIGVRSAIKDREKRKTQLADVRIEEQVRFRIFEAILKRAGSSVNRGMLNFILQSFVNYAPNDVARRMCTAHDWKCPKTPWGAVNYSEGLHNVISTLADASIPAFALELAFTRSLDVGNDNREPTKRPELLTNAITFYKIDAKKIEAEVRAAVPEKKPAKVPDKKKKGAKK
jgi:ParB/RepB/Spo0J family partition protein